MKKGLILILFIICTLSADADTGDTYVGIQTVWATAMKAPGFGANLQEDLSDNCRMGFSINYFPKHKEITNLNGNLDTCYYFPLNKLWRIGPLIGLTVYYSWWKDKMTEGVLFENEDNTYDMKTGLNLGAGVEYLINDDFVLTGDCRYQFLSGENQFLLSIGISYYF
ncbi:MAG: outer membrane beta-barrel protein [Prevotella sp.]|nr:outer membrane beta-barrel protein [Prevotella sp.]MBR1464182.1 outer membrane beta-barrel protein [Prevotella sp.]